MTYYTLVNAHLEAESRGLHADPEKSSPLLPINLLKYTERNTVILERSMLKREETWKTERFPKKTEPFPQTKQEGDETCLNGKLKSLSTSRALAHYLG